MQGLHFGPFGVFVPPCRLLFFLRWRHVVSAVFVAGVVFAFGCWRDVFVCSFDAGRGLDPDGCFLRRRVPDSVVFLPWFVDFHVHRRWHGLSRLLVDRCFSSLLLMFWPDVLVYLLPRLRVAQFFVWELVLALFGL